MKILDNLQALVTIGYLIMVLLGITFTSAKFSQFGIDIISYSDALDFLIAPFKDLQIMLFAAVPIFLIYCFMRFDGVLMNNFPRFYSMMYLGMHTKKWFRKAWILQWVLMIVLYTIVSSNIYGDKVKRNFDLEAKSISIEFMNNKIQKGKLIGSNPNFLFIQDSLSKTLVIPINSSVRSIQVFDRNEGAE